MSKEWIPIEIELPDDPQVRRIARHAGISVDAVVGKLVRVWGWFDRSSVDGFVDACVDADVDDLARHDGFARALASVGWLIIDRENERIGIPGFEVHQGNSTRKRLLKSGRQARYRASKAKRSVDAHVDASVDAHVDAGASTNASPTRTRTRTRTKEQEQELRPVANATVRVTEPQSGDLLGGNGEQQPVPKKPPIPVQAIVDLYHQLLPELPRVFKLTTARRAQIAARWREDLTDMDDWTDYFTRVRSSAFLMGLEPPGPGRNKPFFADLEWLTRPANFTKIIEGKYYGKAQANRAGR